MMVKWTTIPDYMKSTGLSRRAVKKLMDDGALEYTTTEGEGRYLLKVVVNDDLATLRIELKENKEILLRLCEHLGIKSVAIR